MQTIAAAASEKVIELEQSKPKPNAKTHMDEFICFVHTQ